MSAIFSATMIVGMLVLPRGTHGITEAVFLGTRVIVLTAGPARMADNFRVELPHPRTLEMKTSERFGEYTRRIYRLLGLE